MAPSFAGLATHTSSGSGVATQTTTYGHDSTAGGNFGIGRLTSVTDPSGSSAFTYDAQGRLVGVSQTIGGQSHALAYSHDANGAVTSITYPSGHVVNYARILPAIWRSRCWQLTLPRHSGR